MITKRSLCVALAIIVAVALFSVTGLVFYYDSFSAALRIGDWRRLPLSYPWHIVDYGENASGVQLEDWRVYAGEMEAKKLAPLPIDAGLEQETLQSLQYIGRFGFKNGCLYGVRDVYCPPDSKGKVATPKWFIMKCGVDEPCYYDTENQYKKHCESLGLDAKSIRSFAEQWDEFSALVSSKNFFEKIWLGWVILLRQN